MALVSKNFNDIVTFSRASAGTYFNSAGVLTTTPVNLFTRSEAFDNAAWTKANTTVSADVATAPNGQNNADLVLETATASVAHYVQYAGPNIDRATQRTISVYVKAAGRTVFQIQDNAFTGNFIRGWYDLTAVTATTTIGGSGVATSATITPIGNGWYRCALTGQPNSVSGGGSDVNFTFVDSGTNTSYTGDPTKGMYFWGAQIEAGSSATTYIPTTSTVSGAPRRNYDPATLSSKGLLIEEQRTNGIRNNTMAGAVVGSPGTQPTNWAATFVGTTSGISASIADVGTEDGISYVDVRFQGTSSVTGTAFTGNLETQNSITAAAGQTWTGSSFVRLTAGSLNGASVTLRLLEAAAAGASIGGASTDSSNLAPTSAALKTQRGTVTRTLTDATCAFCTLAVRLGLTSGVVYDFTLRIGMPQLEQGAFATSVIPTTSAQVTRSTDVATINTLSPWFNATEGTLFAEFDSYGGSFPTVFSINDGTLNNRINLLTSTATTRFGVNSGGVSQADIFVSGYSANSIRKSAGAYKANDFSLATGGTLATPDTSGSVPTVTKAELGFQTGGLNIVNGHLRKLAYYPTRLPDATLQSLTA